MVSPLPGTLALKASLTSSHHHSRAIGCASCAPTKSAVGGPSTPALRARLRAARDRGTVGNIAHTGTPLSALGQVGCAPTWLTFPARNSWTPKHVPMVIGAGSKAARQVTHSSQSRYILAVLLSSPFIPLGEPTLRTRLPKGEVGSTRSNSMATDCRFTSQAAISTLYAHNGHDWTDRFPHFPRQAFATQVACVMVGRAGIGEVRHRARAHARNADALGAG